MTRFPITGGRSYGRAPNPQPTAATIEPVDDREEIPHIPVNPYYLILHPTRMNGVKWFKNNTEVSSRVRKIIEGCFKGPWYSWKRVPLFYREAWFSTFKTKYQWDASIDNLVQAHFDKLAATRLKGMVSLAKSNASKPNGEKPDWILSEHWRVMVAYWRTPSAKTISEKARASRLSDRNGLGPIDTELSHVLTQKFKMFWKQTMKTILSLLCLKEHTKNLMEHLLTKEPEKLWKDTMSVFKSVYHRWMERV